MNTKGIKFLAVLAVLAMAFAAFAVLTDAETDDATAAVIEDVPGTYKSPGSDTADTRLITYTDEAAVVGTAGKYVIVNNATISSTITSGEVIVYVKAGSALTISSIASGGSVKVIPVSVAEKALTAKTISMTFTAASALVVTTVDSGSTTLTGTSATMSGAVIDGTTELTIDSCAITNAGSIKIKGTTSGLIVNGTGSLISGSVNGKIIATESHNGSGNPCIHLKGGTIDHQDISLSKDVTEENGIWVGNHDGAKVDASLTNNNIEINSKYGVMISTHGSGDAFLLTVSNNVFTSSAKINHAVAIGAGSSAPTAPGFHAAIHNNNYNGIKGYNNSTDFGKTSIRFNQVGQTFTLGKTNTSSSGVQVAIDDGCAVGVTQGAVTVKESLFVSYLGIMEGRAVNVDATCTLTNNGTIVIAGTLEFARTTGDKTLSQVGLQGSGDVSVKSTGKLILNQDKSNKLASGDNTITVENGGTMFATITGSTNYWNLIGPTNAHGAAGYNASHQPIGNDTEGTDGYMFATGVASAPFDAGSVTIKATIGSGSISYTSYTLDGVVTIGASDADSWTPGYFYNDYFVSNDKVIINGKTTFAVNVFVNSGVEVNVTESAKLIAGTPLKDVFDNDHEVGFYVSGIVNYADAAQVFKNTTIETGGKVNVKGSGGGSDEKTVIDNTTTDVKAETFTDADVVVTTAAVTQAVIPAGKTLVIENTTGLTAASVIDVSSAESSASIVGAAAKSFSVKLDSTTTVKVTGFSGTATFMKGSIIINGDTLTDGTFTLKDGDVVKLSGAVTASTFNYEGTTGSATIMIESGDDKALALGGVITINSDKISLVINGKVTGTAGTSKFNYNSTVADGSVTINDGAIVNGIDFVNEAAKHFKISVYSGSDINKIGNVTWTDITGKDANGGEWNYNTTDDKNILILKGYQGTYNFQKIAAAIKAIELNGDNKVDYVFAADYDNTGKILFGNAALTNIYTPSSGSLEIVVDISKIGTGKLFTGEANNLVVIKMIAPDVTISDTNLDGVVLKITVSGENAAWTADDTKEMYITGIDATTAGFSMFNSDISIDIASAYTSKDTARVFGINSAVGAIIVKSTKSFEIKTSGVGVKSNATGLDFDNAGSVTIEGKKSGILMGAGIPVKLTSVQAMSVKGGVTSGIMTVKESSVTVAGDSTVYEIVESNYSSISFTGKATIGGTGTGDVSIKQESTLTLKNGSIKGTLTNGGILAITGNVAVLDTGKITNEANMTNTGVLGVYGDFENEGAFSNEGTVEILKSKFAAAANQTITLAPVDPSTSLSNVKFSELKFVTGTTKITSNADGSASISKAQVKYRDYAGVEIAEATNEYSGTFTPALDGGYVLTLKNKDDTCTIAITYSIKTGDAAGNQFGKSYAISVTGNVIIDSDTYYLEGNKTGTGASTITDGILAVIEASGAKISTNDDSVIINEGTFTVSSDATAIDVKGLFTGDLVTNVATATTVSGAFTGNLTANGTGAANTGAVTIGADAVLLGNITAKGTVTINGAVTGETITTEKGVTAEGEDSAIIANIVAKDNVTITDMLGNITVNANGPKTVTVKGAMLGNIIYVSKYKAASADTEPTEYTAKMAVVGEANGAGFSIILAAGSDATASAAVVPGYFKIDNGMVALETGKTVQLTLSEGKLLIDSAIKMKAGYYLDIEAGTTIEVNKSAASLDVTEAALKVSKDATANFETGSATPVNYGKVLYIMSFTIDDAAYTIYSDVAYALSNCDEGSELTVGANAPINTNVSVPAGVNIIVKDVTLTFSGMDVKMGEGAKITLQGTGKLVFNTSKDNTATVKADEDYEYYSVTACIVYGDNELDLMGVRFNADNNVIVGKAATETALAMIDVDLKYNEGTAMITEGAAIGDLKLANVEYYPTKAAETAGEKKLAAAAFAIAEDAHFELESFTDAKMDAKMTAGEIEVLKRPTMLAIAGTLEVCASITVNGTVLGAGSISLDDDKTITLAYGKILDAEKKIYFGPSFTGTIFDDRLNGFEFTAIDAVPEGAAAGATFAITADKTNECITFAGKLYSGSIEAVSDSSVAMLNGVTICDDAILEAPNAIISGANVSNGLFKNVEMTKKTGATLDYGATYTEGAYTVYTIFKNIDLEEISDITLTKDLNVKDLTEASKVDLSGADVNITIAEGKKLIVDKILIIGTPITVLGDEGSSISGKVVIEDGFYLVAYADVDLTFAEILGDDAKTDAVFSKLDVEDMPYAVIFASNQGGAATDIVLAKADAALIPEIVGYNFTAWLNYNGDAKALVGETNAYADAKEVYVTVVVKYVAGVDYYMNGVLFNVYDIPTDVAYGSYFTAKISDTTKYQGNPLINGQKTVCVDDDMELVASGVTPIPEPEPEPVIGDSGISLTDILLIVLVVLIAIMVVILVLRLNRS